MAKNAFGTDIINRSGSMNTGLGGMTYLKNGVQRVRVVPVNPQTALQQNVRITFLFLTSDWAFLSQANRTAWESARTGDAYWLKADPFTGTSRPYASAKDLYIGANMSWLTSDGSLGQSISQFAVPGTTNGVDDGQTITSFVFDASAGTAVLTYTDVFTKEKAIIECTPPVSAGIMRTTSIESKFRVISPTPGASPAALGAAYVNVFGAITGAAGKKVFWRVWGVDLLTGRKRLIGQSYSVIVA